MTLFKSKNKNPNNKPKNIISFGSYWVWIGILNSYKCLKQEIKNGNQKNTDKKRLLYLQKQIIWYFLKNFFLFPFWFLSLLIPSYMKGEVNVWTNLRTIGKLIMSKEFKPLRMAVVSQFVFLYIVIQLGFVVFVHFSKPTLAATYNFVQTSWTTVSTTATAAHPTNETNWANYFSASSTISTGTEIELLPVSVSTTHTSDTDFSTGSFSSTTVSGTGSSAGVQLTSTTTPFNSWSTVLPAVPSFVSENSVMIRNGTADEIYIY